MRAKNFLEQVYLTALRVDSRLEQISHLQAMATRTTSVMKSVPCSCSQSSSSRIETAIVSMQIQSDKLAEEIDTFLEARQKVSEVIMQLDNKTERVLLELRYLCFYSWQAITKLMTLSRESVFRLHRNALNNVEKKIDTK